MRKSDKEDAMQTARSFAFPDEKFHICPWNREICDSQESSEDFGSYHVDITEDLESWAKNFGVQSGLLHEIPESVRPHFNYAGWARDALQNGGIRFFDLFEDAIAVFYKRRV